MICIRTDVEHLIHVLKKILQLHTVWLQFFSEPGGPLELHDLWILRSTSVDIERAKRIYIQILCSETAVQSCF